MAFCASLMKEMTSNFPVVGGVVCKVELVHSWFGSIFVIFSFFNIRKMFAKKRYASHVHLSPLQSICIVHS